MVSQILKDLKSFLELILLIFKHLRVRFYNLELSLVPDYLMLKFNICNFLSTLCVPTDALKVITGFSSLFNFQGPLLLITKNDVKACQKRRFQRSFS